MKCGYEKYVFFYEKLQVALPFTDFHINIFRKFKSTSELNFTRWYHI